MSCEAQLCFASVDSASASKLREALETGRRFQATTAADKLEETSMSEAW